MANWKQVDTNVWINQAQLRGLGLRPNPDGTFSIWYTLDGASWVQDMTDGPWATLSAAQTALNAYAGTLG